MKFTALNPCYQLKFYHTIKKCSVSLRPRTVKPTLGVKRRPCCWWWIMDGIWGQYTLSISSYMHDKTSPLVNVAPHPPPPPHTHWVCVCECVRARTRASERERERGEGIITLLINGIRRGERPSYVTENESWLVYVKHQEWGSEDFPNRPSLNQPQVHLRYKQ